MNFFWANSKLSWLRYLTLYSFRYYHPDWTMRLYTYQNPACQFVWDDNVSQDIVNYDGLDYIKCMDELDIQIIEWTPPLEGLMPASASDMFQWEILHKHGGYYADMDILFIGQIPHEQYCDVDNLFCLAGEYMAIGFFGASKGSQLMLDLFNRSQSVFDPASYQSTGAITIYDLAKLYYWNVRRNSGMEAVHIFQKKYLNENTVCLPSISVYPYQWTEIKQIFVQKRVVQPECFGIHWFGGDILSQKMNVEINYETWSSHDNTFIKYANKCLTDFDKTILDKRQ